MHCIRACITFYLYDDEVKNSQSEDDDDVADNVRKRMVWVMCDGLSFIKSASQNLYNFSIISL